MKKQQRPLSPHLQIYDMFRFTSFMSIMHRITGITTSLGLIFITIWLAMAASGESAYYSINRFISNPFIVLCLFFWTGGLCYHFCTGIRHLVWDIGKGLDIKSARKSATYAQIGTVVLNVSLWIAIWSVA